MPYMTLPRGFSIEFLLLALYCALDPFGHSPIAGFPHFEVHKIDMPAWSEVPTDRDKDNSLQKSEVLFVNQVQGPESIAFDPLGRGPYTGVTLLFNPPLANSTAKFYNSLNSFHAKKLGFNSSKNKEFHSVGTLVLSGEASGRVLKYNLATKETTVLMRNVQFPNGISLSKDASLFVFSEGMNGRVRKYWLKGVKAGTSEILAILPGFPDNVRVNGNGDFWVAIHCRRYVYSYLNALYPKMRKVILKIPTRIQCMFHIGGRFHAVVVKYSPEGKLLRILEDSEGKVVRAV
ncbi:hypothetical protein JHK87_037748 [Glycine soja]|nr:hypothetical protein JHK87_037748 [Glycine soja]